MCSIKINNKRLKRAKWTLHVSLDSASYMCSILNRGDDHLDYGTTISAMDDVNSTIRLHLDYSTTISALDDVNTTISTITRPSQQTAHDRFYI